MEQLHVGLKIVHLYKKMLVTPEIVTLLAGVVGLLGIIGRKARCFVRRVNGRWSYGVGFTEGRIIPEPKQDINIQMGCQLSPPIASCQRPEISADIKYDALAEPYR